MKLVNLTPHAITLKNSDVNITVQPSGILARVNTQMNATEKTVAGIPVAVRVFGEVDFGQTVFDPEDVFLVSSMVLDALSVDHPLAGRCFAPNTDNTAERNDKGHIISVCQLVGKF